MRQRETRKKSIALFGHFDSSNFGNESTLQAILYNIRQRHPDATLVCISTGPEGTVATHNIEAIPISEKLLRFWVPRNPLTRVLRKFCIALVVEPYSWVKGFLKLKRTDMLVIPGTGLVTDAYGLLNWGPYSLFKWSVIAKLCRSKLLYISIGAGPIHTPLGRRLIRAALALSDFRSYRDLTSMMYLNSIGFRTGSDRVYPDLAFSLPYAVIPRQCTRTGSRKVVGLGVMGPAGTYSTSSNSDASFLNYLQQLETFVTWLLREEYDVRLLIGDLGDVGAKQELVSLLKKRLLVWDDRRIIDERISSVQDLLSQISATDVVVATRFHNVLLALLCKKPVLSIAFHHKCELLMRAVHLPEYCLDINGLKADKLIEKFCDLEKNADNIKLLIESRSIAFREELDEQYNLIFNYI